MLKSLIQCFWQKNKGILIKKKFDASIYHVQVTLIWERENQNCNFQQSSVLLYFFR